MRCQLSVLLSAPVVSAREVALVLMARAGELRIVTGSALPCVGIRF